MKATLVPDKQTPLTARDALRAFNTAFLSVTGREPRDEVLALAVAQSALETGRWRHIHNYNFGNVKASDSYEGMYCHYRCNEVKNGKVEWYNPPHPQTRFRAFNSAEEGAIDQVRFLSSSPRYSHAWNMLMLGDPVKFVKAIKSAGYFTAEEAPYLKAVSSIFREFMGLLR